MNTAEVDAYLRAKSGAEKDFKAEWGVVALPGGWQDVRC